MIDPAVEAASTGARDLEGRGARRPRGRTALIVTTREDSPTCAELQRSAERGDRPRRDYVELARVLDADVIDIQYMRERATRLARAVARTAGLPAGQVVEALLREHRYDHVCAWADRLGLPLALLNKLGRRERDLVLISVWLSSATKASMLKTLKVHSHLRAIINYGSAQATIASRRLDVPEEKLYLARQPVDERFWRARVAPRPDVICSVGWEHRDYPTLLEAVRGLDVTLEIAVGTVSMFEPTFRGGAVPLPPNVVVHHKLDPPRLRELYERSCMVVVPVQDVEFDAGVTAMGEAMSMSRPVVVTKTRGQGDTLRHGVEGLYVPPADPRALRAALEDLLRDRARAAEMGRAGRELVERELTLDRYVDRLARIIRGDRSVRPFEPSAARAGAELA